MPMSWATATARAPDGGRLVHHQQAPVIGQLLVESTQALLVVGQGPVEDPPARPGSGPWPSARSLPTPGTDEDLDVLDIHLSCRLSLHGCRASRWTTGPRTHACERPHTQRAVPLISSHQRPTATGDFHPGSSTQTGTKHPRPQQLAQPRTTNKVKGRRERRTLASTT